MYKILKKFFDFDPIIRVFLRFIIETSFVIFIYLLWLIDIENFQKLSIIFHFGSLIIWLFTYKLLGLGRDRIRHSSLRSYIPILYFSAFFSASLTIWYFIYSGNLIVYNSMFLFIATLNTIVALRLVAREVIRKKTQSMKDNVLVYGTSDIAIDLMNSLAFSNKYNVVGFISDANENAKVIAGLPVIHLVELERFAEANNCKLVILARDEEYFVNKSSIFPTIINLGLSVCFAPTMDKAFDYEVQLKAITPEDVLGRPRVDQIDAVVGNEIKGKTLLVTGAGGSIGSELCRQILRYEPGKLILLEVNELALYSLEQELSVFLRVRNHKTVVKYILTSITDETKLESIFKNEKIEIIYHAAAYKHVPILEDNIVSGIENNVFGTNVLAKLAHRAGAEKFILISTDKAVRPTNVMGASKRLAELIIQDLSKYSQTKYAIVRFGNVLGSSGSVIPKFKNQINAGGPVTVTHPEINRFFMSIPEASHLVLNAGAMASGGETFLLDMGDPVKIIELAKSLIRQHGLQPVLAAELGERKLRFNEILIEYTGLRPGEKLYEELLVDGVAQTTANQKIFRSTDGIIENLDMNVILSRLAQHVKENNASKILELLRELPISYQTTVDVPTSNIDKIEVSEPKSHLDKPSENLRF